MGRQKSMGKDVGLMEEIQMDVKEMNWIPTLMAHVALKEKWVVVAMLVDVQLWNMQQRGFLMMPLKPLGHVVKMLKSFGPLGQSIEVDMPTVYAKCPLEVFQKSLKNAFKMVIWILLGTHPGFTGNQGTILVQIIG